VPADRDWPVRLVTSTRDHERDEAGSHPNPLHEGAAVIVTQAQFESLLAADGVSPWARAAYQELIAKVADPAFPCTFGTTALRKGDVLVSVIESTDEPIVVDRLTEVLTEYADFIRQQPIVKASMMPLAVLMPPPPSWRTVEDYFRNSWRLLQIVHERDPAAWPERVPTDPDDPRWSFCFGGVPFFVNFKTPMHSRRRSRRTSHSYLWLVQARDGFDTVAGDSPQGRNARRIIREKLAAYDGIPIYSELAHYGSSANREWKQYFVPDGDEPITQTCPFRADRSRGGVNRTGS
jgi:FPC/CPF motif-containing protein YcgG